MQTIGKPSWFAFKLERREVLELLPPEKLAHVLKMCFDFLETRQRPDDGDALERLAFAAIAPDIEAAWEKYDSSVRNGRKGGRPAKTQGFSENRGVFEKPEETHIDIDTDTDTDKDTDKDTERERETEEDASAPPAPAQATKGNGKKAPVRHRYGRYQRVLLSGADLETIKSEFPGDWQERISRLDEYIESSGKIYKNHLATIRAWARRDDTERKVVSFGKPQFDYQPDPAPKIRSAVDDLFD